MSQKLTLRKVLFLLFVMSLLGMGFWGISLGQNKTTITLENGEVREPWRPKYTNTDNDLAEVDVIISNGPANSHVDFSLSNVTDWEGYCMNAGNQSDDDKDLKMNKGDQEDTPLTWSDPTNGTGGGQKIRAKWTGAAPVSFTLKVRSYDYGAYGDVTASLYEDPPIVSNTVNIPRDNNNNRIADGWRKDDAENYNASADDETGPGGNTYPGDGFSVFEEYRGFMVKGNHVDTNPAKKDIFIYSDWVEGVGYANEENLPSVFSVHKIDQDEMGQALTYYFRRMDYQGTDVPGGVATPQKALWVKKDTEAGGIQYRLGVTYGPRPRFVKWTPYQITSITVYKKRIDQFVNQTLDRPLDASDPPADKVETVVDSTIAHEIGHGIGLGHDLHTPGDFYDGFCIMEAGIDWINRVGPKVPHRFLQHHYNGADPTDRSGGFGPGMYKLRLPNE